MAIRATSIGPSRGPGTDRTEKLPRKSDGPCQRGSFAGKVAPDARPLALPCHRRRTNLLRRARSRAPSRPMPTRGHPPWATALATAAVPCCPDWPPGSRSAASSAHFRSPGSAAHPGDPCIPGPSRRSSSPYCSRQVPPSPWHVEADGRRPRSASRFWSQGRSCWARPGRCPPRPRSMNGPGASFRPKVRRSSPRTWTQPPSPKGPTTGPFWSVFPTTAPSSP